MVAGACELRTIFAPLISETTFAGILVIVKMRIMIKLFLPNSCRVVEILYICRK